MKNGEIKKLILNCVKFPLVYTPTNDAVQIAEYFEVAANEHIQADRQLGAQPHTVRTVVIGQPS